MNTPTTQNLSSAIEAFFGAPTRDNHHRLLEAADEYRDLWIEAQASGKPLTTHKTPPREPTTTYDRKREIMETIDGIPVKLALQSRTSASVEKPWWVLSWRTRYSSGGSNRRFYLTKEGCWTLPAATALEMMQQMAEQGGFDEAYFDHRRRPDFETIVSTGMSPTEKQEWLERITGPDEDWGSDPYFVITFDPNENWKKVMIVNTDDDTATFRSITEDPEYMPKKVLRPGADWWLDNSMMDANVQQMSPFLTNLEEYFESR